MDNDCDGVVDNNLTDVGGACGTGEPGVCSAGIDACTDGSLTCAPINTPIEEVCDGLDNNCDEAVDEGNPGGGVNCVTDELGVCSAGTTTCANSELLCLRNVGPSSEICDGLDNNCDGVVDEGNPGEGASCDTGQSGVCSAGTFSCTGGAPVCEQNVLADGELCDGLDNDCDGSIDEGGVCGADTDGDTFPAPFDCDDTNNAINPGATEIANDGVDNNCNGFIDEVNAPSCSTADNDQDGISECGGDCDDNDNTVFPGAPELCDGKDNDCNTNTTKNCEVGETCNFPGDPDVCVSDLLCASVTDASGAPTGQFKCTDYCNSSETGAAGEFCPNDGVCSLDLLRSANVHICGFVSVTPGTIMGGETCSADSECRSLNCNLVFPQLKICIDYCGSDFYCEAAETTCRVLRTATNIDGRCWPSNGPGIGANVVGTTSCSADNECDHGFCTSVPSGGSICTEACVRDTDCPSSFTCSLQGDQIATSFAVAQPGTPFCDASTPCPGGLTCLTGSNECAFRLTETTPVCLPDVATQGTAVAGQTCALNSDCQSNFCEKNTSVCVDVCGSDADCPADLTCLLQAMETIPDSSGNAQATNARVCVNGQTQGVLERK